MNDILKKRKIMSKEPTFGCMSQLTTFNVLGERRALLMLTVIRTQTEQHQGSSC